MTKEQKPLIILVFALFLLLATAWWWKHTNIDNPGSLIQPSPTQPAQPSPQLEPPKMPPIGPLKDIDLDISPPEGDLPEELPLPGDGPSCPG